MVNPCMVDLKKRDVKIIKYLVENEFVNGCLK